MGAWEGFCHKLNALAVMKLFIESADVEKIKDAWTWGVLDGVMTSPELVAQTGKRADETYRGICAAVDGPVCIEAVALMAKDIASEARMLSKIGRNVIVKISITKDGLKTVKRLEGESITTNVTAAFSPLQALLAAKAGASYVSLLVSRLDEIGQAGLEVVRQTKAVFRNYTFKTQIIVSGVQNPIHLLEAALAGADVCAASYEVLDQLYQHPLTNLGIAMSLKQWAKVPKAAVTPPAAEESRK